jgi:hypothetical protein
MELEEGRNGKENDSQQHWNTSVQIEDTTICFESSWIVGGGKEGVKESNGRGWINQSKVCSQRRYIEKPLWTLTLELIMKDMTVRSVHGHGGEGEQRRDEGEEIWLMCFTHIYKIELWNFL